MARPHKKRRICREPKNKLFRPHKCKTAAKAVLTMDEYEAVRLIDYEGFTQEECAAQMTVSRTTVQNIYASARRKIADSLVNGKELLISGGDYVVCKNYKSHCEESCCTRCQKNCSSKIPVTINKKD